MVDNQEEVLNVRILPARPINDDQEYAGRKKVFHFYFNVSFVNTNI